MTATGNSGLHAYLTSVSGYDEAVPCVQTPYSNAFYFNPFDNCQSSAAAAVYAACLCDKDGDVIRSSMTSDVVTNSLCTDGEDREALQLYTRFCAGAKQEAAAITRDAGGGAGSSSVPGGSGTIGTASKTGSDSRASASASSSPSTSDSSNNPSHHGLSPGAIGGIAAAVIIVLIAAGVLWVAHHKKWWPFSGARNDDRSDVALRELAKQQRLAEWNKNVQSNDVRPLRGKRAPSDTDTGYGGGSRYM